MALPVLICCMALWQACWQAGNYDITELFIDGILRITDHDMAAAAKVLNAIDKITSNIEVVVTVSANAADLPEDLKKFVI